MSQDHLTAYYEVAALVGQLEESADHPESDVADVAEAWTEVLHLIEQRMSTLQAEFQALQQVHQQFATLYGNACAAAAELSDHESDAEGESGQPQGADGAQVDADTEDEVCRRGKLH